jgi:single-strand DNA-binding protein
MSERSVNNVTLMGRLGRDAETKFTPSGAAATRFSIATSRSWKDKSTGELREETNWTNVVLWQSEKVAEYLTKGKRVYIEGRLQTRSYDDKDGKKVYATEVVAETLILLGGEENGRNKQEGAARQGSAGAASRRREDEPAGSMDISDEDVPF